MPGRTAPTSLAEERERRAIWPNKQDRAQARPPKVFKFSRGARDFHFGAGVPPLREGGDTAADGEPPEPDSLDLQQFFSVTKGHIRGGKFSSGDRPDLVIPHVGTEPGEYDFRHLYGIGERKNDFYMPKTGRERDCHATHSSTGGLSAAASSAAAPTPEKLYPNLDSVRPVKKTTIPKAPRFLEDWKEKNEKRLKALQQMRQVAAQEKANNEAADTSSSSRVPRRPHTARAAPGRTGSPAGAKKELPVFRQLSHAVQGTVRTHGTTTTLVDDDNDIQGGSSTTNREHGVGNNAPRSSSARAHTAIAKPPSASPRHRKHQRSASEQAQKDDTGPIDAYTRRNVGTSTFGAKRYTKSTRMGSDVNLHRESRAPGPGSYRIRSTFDGTHIIQTTRGCLNAKLY